MGAVIVICNIALIYLSHRLMGSSQRGARLLERFICMGDLLCGITIFAVLIYPYLFTPMESLKPGTKLISCVLQEECKMLDMFRLLPVLFLVALARHFYTMSLFSSNSSRFSPGVAIAPAIPPTIFLLCMYIPHLLPFDGFPSFCINSHRMPSVSFTVSLSTAGCLLAALVCCALDHFLNSRKTWKGGPSIWSTEAQVSHSPAQCDKERNEFLNGHLSKKGSNECLLPEYTADMTVASDIPASHIRTFCVVSLNGVLMVWPLMLAMMAFLFKKGNLDTSDYVTVLSRWTLLSLFNGLTSLYYAYMPMYT